MSPANTQIQQRDQDPNRKAGLVRQVRELDFEIALLSFDAITIDDLAVLRPLGRWLDTISLRKLHRKRALTNALAKAA